MHNKIFILAALLVPSDHQKFSSIKHLYCPKALYNTNLCYSSAQSESAFYKNIFQGLSTEMWNL